MPATGRRRAELHERYLELFRINFIAPNPVPVKAALAAMGIITDALRRPLLSLDDGPRARLLDVMASVGLTTTRSTTATTSAPTTTTPTGGVNGTSSQGPNRTTRRTATSAVA